jgi:hypothetical protein
MKGDKMNKAKTGKTVFFGGYIPKNLALWATRQARKQNRSVTGYILNILEEKRDASKRSNG